MLLVVAFHALPGALSGGFVGVDVFFVLSGFLITGLLVDEVWRTGSVSLLAFYARRIRRLLPMACLVLVVTTLVFRDVMAPIDRPALFTDVASAAVWTSNWHFAAGATEYMADVDHSPVLHYWSLSVEEQFYLVWPLVVLVLAATGRRRVPWARLVRRLSLVLLALTVASFLTSALTSGSAGPWAYFGLHTRGWELAAGGLLALARDRLAESHGWWTVPAGWLGLLMVIGSALRLDGGTVFPGLAAGWPVGGAVLLVAAGTRSANGAAGLLATPPLTSVGRLSYAWYLWHWPCLVFARLVTEPPGGLDPDLPRPPIPAPHLAAALAASLALAVASHWLVEERVRRAPGLAGSPTRSLAVGAALLLAATVLPAAALRGPTPLAVAAGGQAVTGTGTDTDTDDELAAAPAPADPTARAAELRRWPLPRHPSPSMTPQQARADDAAPQRCFVGFVASTADPACRFGDPAGRRVVVLFGDSHAAHWYPAVEQVAATHGWRLYFWAKSSCGYADAPEWLSGYNRFYTECAAWRHRVLTAIADLPRVDAVLIGRSSAQFSKLRGGSGDEVTDAEAARQWGSGADAVLSALRSAAGVTVLLRDVPRPAGDVPACLSANPGLPQRCDYPRAGHVARDAAVFAAEQVPVAATGTKVLDLGDLVCSTDPCPVVSPGGAIIFRDAHHLTATFAREVATAVGRRLTPLVEAAG